MKLFLGYSFLAHFFLSQNFLFEIFFWTCNYITRLFLPVNFKNAPFLYL